jgi:hypothetical protein
MMTLAKWTAVLRRVFGRPLYGRLSYRTTTRPLTRRAWRVILIPVS